MPPSPSRSKRALLLTAAVAASLLLSAAPTEALRPPIETVESQPKAGAKSSGSFRDTFRGSRLKQKHWTSSMTSRAANGWPWTFPLPDGTQMLPGHSAIGAPGGNNSEFYTPTGLRVKNELRLIKTRSMRYSGYEYQSGVVTTYGKREFKRGTLTVRAKMPNMRHGAWPAIWLLPSHTAAASGNGDRNELDLFEGGFRPEAVGLPASTPINRIVASHYHEGVWPNAVQHQGAIVGPDLTKGFHNYTVKYRPGHSIRTYIDGRPVATFTEGVSRDPYFLILNNAHASAATADWHTVGSEKRSVMRVKWVRWRK